MLVYFCFILAYWPQTFQCQESFATRSFWSERARFRYFRHPSIMDMLPKIDAPKYCTICNLTFEGQEAYEKHQSKLHRKGDIECEYCYKRFLRKEYLARNRVHRLNGPPSLKWTRDQRETGSSPADNEWAMGIVSSAVCQMQTGCCRCAS